MPQDQETQISGLTEGDASDIDLGTSLLIIQVATGEVYKIFPREILEDIGSLTEKTSIADTDIFLTIDGATSEAKHVTGVRLAPAAEWAKATGASGTAPADRIPTLPIDTKTSGNLPASRVTPEGTDALTFASALTWDVGASRNASITLTGNVTSISLSNDVDGGVYTLRIIQDGTGGRTFDFPSAWLWQGGTEEEISSAASSVTLLTIRKIGSSIYVAPLGTGYA